MDPVTTAIIAAVEAGVNSAAGDVAKKALVDCYDGLKALLKKKFGSESDVAEAVDKLEVKPEAKGRRQTGSHWPVPNTTSSSGVAELPTQDRSQYPQGQGAAFDR